jgi:hypothetical protein
MELLPATGDPESLFLEPPGDNPPGDGVSSACLAE